MIALGSQYIVVLDTCVLAPMPLCDTLLRLAEDPAFFIPKWSHDALRELRVTLLRMGYSEAQAERRITAMETAFEGANVEGYEELIAGLKNDPKDRHVLAAAIRSGAHAILTSNVRHFPPESTAPYAIDVLAPDQFLVQQFHQNQELLVEKLRGQAAALRSTFAAVLARLGKHAPSLARLLAE